MSTGHDDRVDAFVALAAGAIIGIAVTFLFVRMQSRRGIGKNANDEDYYYEGGDLFI